MAELNALSKTQHVYEELRQQLLMGRYAPEERMKISALSKQFALSHGGIREALSRLTSEGLIALEPQKGFRVAAVSAADLRQLSAAQREIEALCLRSAIEVGDLNWQANVVASHYQLIATPQRDENDAQHYNSEFVDAYRAFRQALVAACDNLWLAKMREMLNVQSLRYQLLSKLDQRDIAKSYQSVVDKTLARDADAACELLDQLMRSRAQYTIDWLESEEAANDVS